jgi:hypothetical protein
MRRSLPSSSPAYALPFAEKLAAWQTIGAFLREMTGPGMTKDTRRWPAIVAVA